MISAAVQQELRISQQDFTAALCQNAGALPFVQNAAGRKWSHIRSGSQIFVRDPQFDAAASGFTDPARETYQQVSNAPARVIAA